MESQKVLTLSTDQAAKLGDLVFLMQKVGGLEEMAAVLANGASVFRRLALRMESSTPDSPGLKTLMEECHGVIRTMKREGLESFDSSFHNHSLKLLGEIESKAERLGVGSEVLWGLVYGSCRLFEDEKNPGTFHAVEMD